MAKKPTISIGICAFNEERNIGALLGQLSQADNADGGIPGISEIIVVSSGSTDKTDSAAKKFAETDRRIRFIREAERRGKVSAVNIILKQAKGDIIVLCGADLQLENGTIRNLIRPFGDPTVGMAGARPVPRNDKTTFMGFCSHMLWDLHHRVALKSPKCGELIAIRNKGYSIPESMPVDEAYLEWRVRKGGSKIAYAPQAIVYNIGPGTISDYLRQRRRIHAQHIWLRKETGYAVATSDPSVILSALPSILFQSPKSFVFGIGAISLETISAILGRLDASVRNEPHKVWDVSESTKVARS